MWKWSQNRKLSHIKFYFKEKINKTLDIILTLVISSEKDGPFNTDTVIF